MIVEIEVLNEKVYLKWAKPKEPMYHIVRDINEAKVFTPKKAKELQERFKHKKARLIKCVKS